MTIRVVHRSGGLTTLNNVEKVILLDGQGVVLSDERMADSDRSSDDTAGESDVPSGDSSNGSSGLPNWLF